MTHGHHHGAFGALAIVAGIAYAFGNTIARVVVGSVIIAVVLAFAYVMFRVVSGTI